MKRPLLYLICFLIITSCSDIQSIKHDLRQFRKTTINLSVSCEVVKNRNISKGVLPTGKETMIVYYDSTECNKCKINHLIDFLSLYDDADNKGTYNVVTIFAPRQEEYDEVMASLMKQDFPYPIYVDFDGSFRKANRCIPEDKRFHSFLLDKDGHPVFVGNPVSSEKMHELFKRALEEACQE